MDNLTSFPIWMPFNSFSCLTGLVRTSHTMLNRSSESWHPCLVPDQRKGFNFSPPSVMLAVGLSYIAFITLRCIPSVSNLLRVFILNRC